ncbi:Cytochrome monooxygenase like protein [Verticillium longisporum]|nr:Cytochrome monooxygenase like protein [Verticillium longisporum]
MRLLKTEVYASLDSVRSAGNVILDKTSIRIRLLINNASIMGIPELRHSADGHELHFGTNHISHFLFFKVLEPGLLANASSELPSRVVSLASTAHLFYGISDISDYNFEKTTYDANAVYSQSKTAVIYLAGEIERRFSSRHLHGTSLHPGIIVTSLTRHMPPDAFKGVDYIYSTMKSVEQGAATTLLAAVGKDLQHQCDTALFLASKSSIMPFLRGELFNSPSAILGTASGAVLILLVAYVVYQQFLHPLAGYPGPLLASLTDLWQVQQYLTLQQPYTLTQLHERYGEFVRYGPDKLSITAKEALPIIYQKGGRRFPKTEFYDAFGGKTPNVFGMRSDDRHAVRRRHMSHGFSISSVKEMEHYLDANVKLLRHKIAGFARDGRPFDLKKLFHYYTIDVLGELAFSRSFGVQVSDDESLVPRVVPHTLLGSVTGAWPSMTQRLKRWLPLVPHAGLQDLFRSRAEVTHLASECVERRLGQVKEQGAGHRPDILTRLIQAKHPDTGEHMPRIDLEAEAFGFLIAGTHTTSATATLLFCNLLRNPEALAACTREVSDSLPPLDDDRPAYSVTQVGTHLPYLRACVRENFRLTPVFSMPLERRVTEPEGVFISGRHIQQGMVVAVCNHAFHHNPRVWGDDHDVFDPSRWDDDATAARARYLMHFGLGTRQCIGKTLALSNVYKLAATLLREFEFGIANAEERQVAARGGFRGKLPEMISVGVSDLKGPLMVTAKAAGRNKNKEHPHLNIKEYPVINTHNDHIIMTLCTSQDVMYACTPDCNRSPSRAIPSLPEANPRRPFLCST